MPVQPVCPGPGSDVAPRRQFTSELCTKDSPELQCAAHSVDLPELQLRPVLDHHRDVAGLGLGGVLGQTEHLVAGGPCPDRGHRQLGDGPEHLLAVPHRAGVHGRRNQVSLLVLPAYLKQIYAIQAVSQTICHHASLIFVA